MQSKTDETPKKKKFNFSFSSITKLMRDPKAFYNEYILGNYDDSTKKFLDEGTIAHCLILNPEDFYEEIVIMNCKVPSDNPRKIIDTVYKLYGEAKVKEDPMRQLSLSNFSDHIIEELRKENLYQTLTDSAKKDKDGNMFTGDEKRLQKIITPDNGVYFATLGNAYKKTIVDFQMIEKAKKKADAVLSHPKASMLLNQQDNESVRMELDLTCNLANYPFGLRGKIDNVKVNNKLKKIIINDVKTTSKTLQAWNNDFKTSPYMYWLQPIIYKELLLSLVPADVELWTLEVNFIVVDYNNNVYCFPVSVDSLRNWEVGAKIIYDKAKWHYLNNSYNLPYDFLNDLVVL
jgi:hypothetical protein